MGGDTDEAADFGFDDHKRGRVGAGKKSVQTVLRRGGRGVAAGEGGGEDALGLELLAQGSVLGLERASLEPGEVALLAEQGDPAEADGEGGDGEQNEHVAKAEAHGGAEEAGGV